MKKILLVILIASLSIFVFFQYKDKTFKKPQIIKSINSQLIWINTRLFIESQTPVALNQEQYNQLFNKLFNSKEVFSDPIEMFKTNISAVGSESDQVKVAKSCAEYYSLQQSGYKIKTPYYSYMYTGSGIYPDELAQCKMLIMMKNLKVAHTNYLSNFTLTENAIDELPTTLSIIFSNDDQNRVLLATKQGKSLRQTESIYPQEFLTSSDSIEAFAEEINMGLPYAKLVLDPKVLGNLQKAYAENHSYSVDNIVKIYNQYVITSIPKVKIIEGKCIYAGGYMDDAAWPGMQQRCLALYFPGNQLLGFVEVARGDFTGNGREDVLLWRYLDITPGGGRGPSLNNNAFLLTRDKPNSMLIDITSSLSNHQ